MEITTSQTLRICTGLTQIYRRGLAAHLLPSCAKTPKNHDENPNEMMRYTKALSMQNTSKPKIMNPTIQIKMQEIRMLGTMLAGHIGAKIRYIV